MALGAQQHDVLWLVLQQGLRLGAMGALLGLGGSFVLMRLLNAVIPTDSPMRDPMMVAGVPVVGWVAAIIAAVALLGVAMLACYLPARRATKVEPMEALRCE
jgi:ABC-type lipoprotein release transport system permease subunit